jgi:hypothetical protein
MDTHPSFLQAELRRTGGAYKYYAPGYTPAQTWHWHAYLTFQNTYVIIYMCMYHIRRKRL